MTNLGEILNTALVQQLSRGQVYSIRNCVWQPALYIANEPQAWHPGLVCLRSSVFAPGTSQKRAAQGTWGQPFTLTKPAALSGSRSTFFLAFRKVVNSDHVVRFMGRIDEEDLVRLNQELGQEREE